MHFQAFFKSIRRSEFLSKFAKAYGKFKSFRFDQLKAFQFETVLDPKS
jgi:hypothetical protein